MYLSQESYDYIDPIYMHWKVFMCSRSGENERSETIWKNQ